MTPRQLEAAAAQLAAMLDQLVNKGKATRELARTMLVSNGETSTARLQECEAVSCPIAEFATVASIVQRWVDDVREATPNVATARLSR